MRTTLNIDDDLLAKALRLTGPMDKSSLMREGLKALIERESAKRLARLGLPSVVVAESDEVLAFIERHQLHGKGIGYVDVHLLASVALTDEALLWTRDKRLLAAADAPGCAYRDATAH